MWLDILAKGPTGEAADVLAQRFKALGQASVDGTWKRAQHLEFVPPVGASLLDRDEEAVPAQVLVAVLKLRLRGDFRHSWQYEGGAGEYIAGGPRGGTVVKGKEARRAARKRRQDVGKTARRKKAFGEVSQSVHISGR